MMKKLLLLICLLVGVGVSMGDTFTFTPFTENATTVASFGREQLFQINGISGNTINLYSVQSENFAFTCTGWYLYKYPSTTVIASGTFSTGLIIINQNLTPGIYAFHYRAGGSCTVPYNNNDASVYLSGFFSNLGPRNINLGTFTWAFPGGTALSLGFNTFTFSGADPSVPVATPITLNINGSSLSFTGTTVFLNGIVDSPTYSGADIVFNVRSVFRALFKAN